MITPISSCNSRARACRKGSLPSTWPAGTHHEPPPQMCGARRRSKICSFFMMRAFTPRYGMKVGFCVFVLDMEFPCWFYILTVTRLPDSYRFKPLVKTKYAKNDEPILTKTNVANVVSENDSTKSAGSETTKNE